MKQLTAHDLGTNHLPIHDGALFTWSKGSGSIERSSIRGTLAGYLDGAGEFDTAMRVKGKGETRTFFLSERKEDQEGELVSLLFTDYKNPYVTVEVWND